MFVLGGLCPGGSPWSMVFVLVFNSVGCCLVRLLLQVKRGWLLLLADSVCIDWQFCIYWLANSEQLEFISVGFWQYRNKVSFNTCTASR
jgi:hypothetical protein